MNILNARIVLTIGIAALVLFPGCLSRRAIDEPTAQSPAPAPTPAPARVDPVITPALSPIGRVASVNAPARFVVLNYPIGQVPPKETRLSVYHAGMKSGELKVTGPEQDNLTVADITAGTAAEGDEVRAD